MPHALLGSPVRAMPIAGRAYDVDAARYISDVEAADGASLEVEICAAINRFVIACKNAGVWGAFRSAGILSGARTLSGALVPLVGPSPTNVNFVGGDYSRKTGLVGNGSTKYLRLIRNNQLPFGNLHLSVFATNTGTQATTQQYIGTSFTAILTGGNTKLRARLQFNANDSLANLRSVGFMGASRRQAEAYVASGGGSLEGIVGTPSNNTNDTTTLLVFGRFQNSGNDAGNTPDILSNARLAWYSLGASVPLNTLDGLVTGLMRDLQGAIP